MSVSRGREVYRFGKTLHVLLLLLLLLHTAHARKSKEPLKCYTDKQGLKFTWCEPTFRTCYTKQDQKGVVLGRGCSSRLGVLYVQCDSHVGNDHKEKFCYCSRDLCNGSHRGQAPAVSLVLLYAAVHALRQLYA